MKITVTLSTDGHGLSGASNWSSAGLAATAESKAIRGSASTIL